MKTLIFNVYFILNYSLVTYFYYLTHIFMVSISGIKPGVWGRSAPTSWRICAEGRPSVASTMPKARVVSSSVTIAGLGIETFRQSIAAATEIHGAFDRNLQEGMMNS